MPTIKIKPEYQATILIVGMYLILWYIGEGLEAHVIIWAFMGIDVITDVQKSGKMNPYIFHPSLKGILHHQWIGLTVLWIFAIIFSFWVP